MNKLSRAICFATEAFDGKYRKAEHSPAIFHSFEAAAIVQSFCMEEDVVCAAILHDTVEDAGVTLSEIKEKFGERVAFLVECETEKSYPQKHPSESWLLRKEESLKVLKASDDSGVKALWLGDKLSNMRSFSRLKERLGEEMWSFFHQKDPKVQREYYQTVAEAISVWCDTEAFREYCVLIKKVFGEESENEDNM